MDTDQVQIVLNTQSSRSLIRNVPKYLGIISPPSPTNFFHPASRCRGLTSAVATTDHEEERASGSLSR